MAQGIFKLKDNAKRWMACKNPPWTFKQLAQAMRYDETFVSQVFNGHKQPSWGFLRRLAEVTGLHDGGELMYFDPRGARTNSRRGGKEAKSP